MNLKNSFLGLDNDFSPKIIGEVNNQYIKVVKIKGDQIPWHNHRKEDEIVIPVALSDRFCSRKLSK
jgi:hypothetical protein